MDCPYATDDSTKIYQKQQQKAWTMGPKWHEWMFRTHNTNVCMIHMNAQIDVLIETSIIYCAN